jgi:Ca2+-binding RTX toxin-like protein
MSKSTRTRHVALAFAVAALAAICAPGAARAAEVSTFAGTDINYKAYPGEDNDLKITDTGSAVVFEEASISISAAPPCAPVTPTKVACSLPGVNQITVNVANGVNKVVSSAPYKTTINGTDGTSNEFKGGPVQNLLLGGYNHDVLTGGAGPDEIQGDDGSDEITGLGGADQLAGGVANDTFFSAFPDGADSIDGGADHDTVDYSARTTSVGVSLDNVANDGGSSGPPLPLPENDNVHSTVEAVRGGSGNDTLRGSSASNSLFGGDGSDLLAGGLGPDRFEGGPGDDTVSYAGYAGPVTVDLDGEIADDGLEAENDTVGADVERIVGGSGADKLTGNASANVIRGDEGGDLIDGLGGSDELFGEGGDDTLSSQDGLADADDCGPGTDTTVADPLDTRVACELPAPPAGGGDTGSGGSAPASGGGTSGAGGTTGDGGAGTVPARPAGPLVRIGPSRLRLDRRGYARLRVSCPATANRRCMGTLRITRRLSGKTRTHGIRPFSIAAGRTATVRVRVTRALRRTLRLKSIRVRAMATARDAVSASRTSQRTVTLRRAG